MAKLDSPVVFDLPDGDYVSLIPWEYVLSQLEAQLRPTMELMRQTNTALRVIDNKFIEWEEGSDPV